MHCKMTSAGTVQNIHGLGVTMFTPNAFQATLGQRLAGDLQAVVLGRQDIVPHLRQKR